jgi:hypothetical protein
MADFTHFRTLVFADPELQEQLWNELDRDAFVVLAVGLAAARGLQVTRTDIERALETGRLALLAR